MFGFPNATARRNAATELHDGIPAPVRVDPPDTQPARGVGAEPSGSRGSIDGPGLWVIPGTLAIPGDFLPVRLKNPLPEAGNGSKW